MKSEGEGSSPRTNSLILLPVEDWPEWDLKLQKSNQCSIFLSSSYLVASGLENRARYLLEGKNIVGGILVPELFPDAPGSPIRNFATYQSVWFTSNETKSFRDFQGRIELLTKLGDLFIASDLSLDLSLHWSIQDIRGLEWSFFGKANKRISFVPRYTGILNLREFDNFTEYLNSISTGRRADYKTAEELEIFETTSSDDVGFFLQMYKETIPFKDNTAMEESLSHVKQLIQNSILSGTGKMWFAKDKMGKPLSGVFIQEFSNTLYYQFGASTAHNLKVSPNALILLKIIENAFQNNFDSLDFVGMNSPKRGAFKASFNPKPKLYFQVMIE